MEKTAICKHCGKSFERMTQRQKGCSQECISALWYKANGIEPPKPRVSKCEVCGVEFTWKKNGHYQIYCSKECRYKRHRETVKKHFDYDATGYRKEAHKTRAKCPCCQQWHVVDIHYIGTGTPRFFCDTCKSRHRRLSFYAAYDQSSETMDYAA